MATSLYRTAHPRLHTHSGATQNRSSIPGSVPSSHRQRNAWLSCESTLRTLHGGRTLQRWSPPPAELSTLPESSTSPLLHSSALVLPHGNGTPWSPCPSSTAFQLLPGAPAWSASGPDPQVIRDDLARFDGPSKVLYAAAPDRPLHGGTVASAGTRLRPWCRCFHPSWEGMPHAAFSSDWATCNTSSPWPLMRPPGDRHP